MSKWPITRLGDVVSIRPPKREVRDRFSDLDQVTFIPMEDLPVRGGRVSGVKIRPLGEVYASYTYFAEGDVLLAKITPCFENGKVGVARGLVNGIGFGSSEFMVLRCGENILPEYLYHVVSRASVIEDGIPNMKGSVGHKRIPQEYIEDLTIPLPPLDEQKRIVAKLDELDGLAKNREAMVLDAITSSQVLFMSFLAEVFEVQAKQLEWPTILFGDFAEHSLGKMLDKGKNLGEPRPYVRNANVQWFEIDTGDIQQMRIEKRERDRYAVLPGDLLICEGGYPGRCAIWNNLEEMYFQKALHRARFDSLGSAKWAMYLLFFLSETGRLARHFSGTGILHLTGERLARVPVPMPSAEVRGLLVDRIEGLHRAVVALTTKQSLILKGLEQFKEQASEVILNGAA